MEEPILITWLNDFIFCPASIYYHNLYGDSDRISFQDSPQINGTASHNSVDRGTYSTRTEILTGITVYCEQYGLIGKIDILNVKKGELVERKKRIVHLYDGYVFQLYGQLFALREMGYAVHRLVLRSMDDNRSYVIPLPEEDEVMLGKFQTVINCLHTMDFKDFCQKNAAKCLSCIYEPLCEYSQKG